MMKLTPILISALLLLANALSAGIQVQTRFSKPKVALGNPVQYIVEIIATDAKAQPILKPITSLPIEPPRGLRLTNGRTSSQTNTQFINGRTEYQVTQSAIIDAIPSKPGSYTIAAFQIQIEGVDYTAPAATLTVVENAADAEPTINELIYLETNLPDSMYLGQTTSVELKLFIANDVRSTRIAGYKLTGDGFSMPSQLPDNERESSEFHNGRRYRVITWTIDATPLSAGPQEVELQFQLNARLPNQRDRFNSRNSPFGESIFEDFFGRSQNFPVYSITAVNVLPLPAKGQPASYSGAIGDFGMEVSTDLQESEVGEPIMLSVKLTGDGNFDRIQAPELPTSANWKLYKPEAQQETDPESGKVISKRFDYVMIPQQAGSLKTPEVSFSFFDPNSKGYSELTSPPLTIKASPSSRRVAQAPIAAPTTNQAIEDAPEINLSRAMTREEALMTLDYQPRSGRQLDCGNPLQSTWFFLLNALLLLATIAAAVFVRKRATLREDADYAQLKQIKAELKRAKAAATQASKAEDFYQHTLAVLRLAISLKAKRDLRNAELPQLKHVLSEWQLSEDTSEALEALFSNAYRTRFSTMPDSTELHSARAQLNQILKAL